MVLPMRARGSTGIATALFGILAVVSDSNTQLHTQPSGNSKPICSGGVCLLQARSSLSKTKLTQSDSPSTANKSSALSANAVRDAEPAYSHFHHDSTSLLAETFQWHGDVFADAFPRDDRNMGFAIFHPNLKTEWTILGVTVVVLLLFDWLVLGRFVNDETSRHVAQLFFWISCGIAYNTIVLARQGRESAIQWCSGYFLEWILSMDNLFVFHLIFSTYATPKPLLHKALFMGIAGAVVFRMFFFMALASLLHLIHWARLFFGLLLIYSGIETARGDDDEIDISNLVVVRWLKWCLGSRMVEKYDLEGHRMIIKEDGRYQATLLVPVVVCLEVTDILFAVDSVTAKVAQIPDYYIAYSSSVLAMFGLRAMFFIVNKLVDMFDLLKYGLCFILVFIGIELLMEDYVKLPAQAVCAVILSIFLVCTAGSTVRNLYKQTNSDGASTASTATTEKSTRATTGKPAGDSSGA